MFNNKDVVCFFGDSITANGRWMAEAYQYLRKKYKIKCYNCGVSGATAKGALFYLHSRCLVFNPDKVVLMYGINDIQRSLYSESLMNDRESKAKRQAAIQTHKESYEELVKEIIASGAEPILCAAVPYDDVTVSETENLACNVGMDELCAFVRTLAEKYGCTLVDFNKVMRPMLSERKIISPDRVHPTVEGYHVMAQVFLNDVGEKEGYDFDTPFEFEPWNEERYDAEMALHYVNFVEFCALLKEGYVENMSYEERKRLARERYEATENKEGFIAKALLIYIEKIDHHEQMVGEIVKRTLF